jgi:CelD/BcsL family acetyltransferase involved in cellulose biosynthesis
MAATSVTESASAGGRLLDPTEDRRWRSLLDEAPCASVFHHPRWLELLQVQYGYRLIACCLADAGGRVRAGLPLAEVSSPLTGRRLVALPFSDVCAPLSADGAEHRLGVLLGELSARLGIAVRVHAPLAGVGRPGATYLHHIVGLEPSVGTVQRRFTRRQALQGVRRAQREGVSIEHRTDREALSTFYRLHAATRRRQGIPTQPRRFILAFTRLFEEGLGFVSLATVGGRAIAAAVFLVFKGTLTYKYGASDVRFLDRRPNNLLFMDAIRWGCERGLHSFDMGRTDVGHESLRAFKLMWGADERLLQYTEFGERGSSGLGHRQPPAIRLLIQHTPPIISRGLGALLYRHVG